ncbi:hypothetical protein ZWY2020_032884 [Hordeum vulgare]|nr:hypothetical protein ZWY2020_032884 [Hordeum vulgare]
MPSPWRRPHLLLLPTSALQYLCLPAPRAAVDSFDPSIHRCVVMEEYGTGQSNNHHCQSSQSPSVVSDALHAVHAPIRACLSVCLTPANVHISMD